MTKADIIKFLRLSVNITDPTIITDTEYLNLTDDDIELFLTLALSRDFPTVASIDEVTQEQLYPLVLLSKKELFYSLASASAPLFDIRADQNNELKRSNRFDHYMKLIAQLDMEYQNLMAFGSSIADNTITSYNVLIPDKYNTLRNYNLGNVPVVTLSVTGVTTTTISISWSTVFSRFSRYLVYYSTSLIYDPDIIGNQISESATLLSTITDIHQTRCRIEGLTANTAYHILVVAEECSGIRGYQEIIATTLS